MTQRAATAFEGSVNAATTKTVRVNVADAKRLRVLWTITNGTGAGNLASTGAKLCDQGRTFNHTIAPTAESAVVFESPWVSKVSDYDVEALGTLELSLTTGAGTAKNVVIRIFTQ